MLWGMSSTEFNISPKVCKCFGVDTERDIASLKASWNPLKIKNNWVIYYIVYEPNTFNKIYTRISAITVHLWLFFVIQKVLYMSHFMMNSDEIFHINLSAHFNSKNISNYYNMVHNKIKKSNITKFTFYSIVNLTFFFYWIYSNKHSDIIISK